MESKKTLDFPAGAVTIDASIDNPSLNDEEMGLLLSNIDAAVKRGLIPAINKLVRPLEATGNSTTVSMTTTQHAPGNSTTITVTLDLTVHYKISEARLLCALSHTLFSLHSMMTSIELYLADPDDLITLMSELMDSLNEETLFVVDLLVEVPRFSRRN